MGRTAAGAHGGADEMDAPVNAGASGGFAEDVVCIKGECGCGTDAL